MRKRAGKEGGEESDLGKPVKGVEGREGGEGTELVSYVYIQAIVKLRQINSGP